MTINHKWIAYSFFGLIYAVSFNLLWLASTSLELIPNVVSWYLPAGLRICVFLFAPYRSWPFLIVFERTAFFLLFQNGGILAAPEYYAESIAWYITHFVLHPIFFLCLVWQYRKRFDGQLLTTLTSSAALIGLFTATSLINAVLFVGRKVFEDEEIANAAISNIINLAIGDLVGIFVIFPLVIILREMLVHFDEKSIATITRSSVVWILVLCGYFFLLEFSRGYDYYVKVLAIIPAIYFSLRYGVIGAMCSVLFLCAMTYMAALLVNGPTLENQFYMIAMSICCFFLGSAVSEQRTTQMALKTLNADLNNSNTELKKSLTQNRLLTGKLIDSQEDERKRLSMDLHDDFGQKISEIKINASMLKRKLPSGLEYANSLIGTADNLYASLKSSIGGLSPSGLDEFGLSEILRTGEVVKLVESQEINYIVNMVGSDSSLSKRQRINLYRIYQEFINNSLKHSKAKRIDVQLECSSTHLYLAIVDDGTGFDVHTVEKGFGLISITERAIALGAEYAITSGQNGTQIEVTLMLNQSISG